MFKDELLRVITVHETSKRAITPAKQKDILTCVHNGVVTFKSNRCNKYKMHTRVIILDKFLKPETLNKCSMF